MLNRLNEFTHALYAWIPYIYTFNNQSLDKIPMLLHCVAYKGVFHYFMLRNTYISIPYMEYIE